MVVSVMVGEDQEMEQAFSWRKNMCNSNMILIGLWKWIKKNLNKMWGSIIKERTFSKHYFKKRECETHYLWDLLATSMAKAGYLALLHFVKKRDLSLFKAHSNHMLKSIRNGKYIKKDSLEESFSEVKLEDRLLSWIKTTVFIVQICC